MKDPARIWHPFGRTREEDIHILAEGGETGWWDDDGRPASWPENFLDPAAGWTNRNNINHGDHRADDDPDNPPF